jgi:hypothetical protein
MRRYRLALLSAVTLSLPLLSLPLVATRSQPAPCPHDVIAARGALGPSAPQSIAAQLHRQPTVASVAAAEKRLGAACCCDAEKHAPAPHRSTDRSHERSR